GQLVSLAPRVHADSAEIRPIDLAMQTTGNSSWRFVDLLFSHERVPAYEIARSDLAQQPIRFGASMWIVSAKRKPEDRGVQVQLAFLHGLPRAILWRGGQADSKDKSAGGCIDVEGNAKSLVPNLLAVPARDLRDRSPSSVASLTSAAPRR